MVRSRGKRTIMKHPSSRAFFAYWDKKRGTARAPDRSDIDPAGVRELLGDIFVLSCEPKLGFPFRVAGTRVCALAGRDLKDQSFAAMFTEASRGAASAAAPVCSARLNVRPPGWGAPFRA